MFHTILWKTYLKVHFIEPISLDVEGRTRILWVIFLFRVKSIWSTLVFCSCTNSTLWTTCYLWRSNDHRYTTTAVYKANTQRSLPDIRGADFLQTAKHSVRYFGVCIPVHYIVVTVRKWIMKNLHLLPAQMCSLCVWVTAVNLSDQKKINSFIRSPAEPITERKEQLFKTKSLNLSASN